MSDNAYYTWRPMPLTAFGRPRDTFGPYREGEKRMPSGQLEHLEAKNIPYEYGPPRQSNARVLTNTGTTQESSDKYGPQVSDKSDYVDLRQKAPSSAGIVSMGGVSNDPRKFYRIYDPKKNAYYSTAEDPLEPAGYIQGNRVGSPNQGKHQSIIQSGGTETVAPVSINKSSWRSEFGSIY